MESTEFEVGLKIIIDLDGYPLISGIYGKEVAFDCYLCDVAKFNRKSLRTFFDKLVKLLDMEKGDLHFWDDVGVPDEEKQTKFETTGTSAIQFILTSNITVHCLDKLERVYINIFSCKDFNTGQARTFIQEWFKADSIRVHVLWRQ